TVGNPIQQLFMGKDVGQDSYSSVRDNENIFLLQDDSISITTTELIDRQTSNRNLMHRKFLGHVISEYSVGESDRLSPICSTSIANSSPLLIHKEENTTTISSSIRNRERANAKSKGVDVRNLLREKRRKRDEPTVVIESSN